MTKTEFWIDRHGAVTYWFTTKKPSTTGENISSDDLLYAVDLLDPLCSQVKPNRNIKIIRTVTDDGKVIFERAE